MTLIEERCEIKSPCASCTRKERCNVGIAQSCPAFNEYANTPVLDRKKSCIPAAFVMAINALRPVSRERVENLWRGCEKCNGAGEYSRYAENLTKILLAKYCPHCGRPLTDEAVEMVMERMEEMKNG